MASIVARFKNNNNMEFVWVRPAFGHGRLGHPQSLEYFLNRSLKKKFIKVIFVPTKKILQKCILLVYYKKYLFRIENVNFSLFCCRERILKYVLVAQRTLTLFISICHFSTIFCKLPSFYHSRQLFVHLFLCHKFEEYYKLQSTDTWG